VCALVCAQPPHQPQPGHPPHSPDCHCTAGGYYEDPGEDSLPEVLASAPALLDFAAVSCSASHE
jgi:hypothetical protein